MSRKKVIADIDELPEPVRSIVANAPTSDQLRRMSFPELIPGCFHGQHLFAVHPSDHKRAELILDIAKKRRVGFGTLGPMFDSYMKQEAFTEEEMKTVGERIRNFYEPHIGQ